MSLFLSQSDTYLHVSAFANGWGSLRWSKCESDGAGWGHGRKGSYLRSVSFFDGYECINLLLSVSETRWIMPNTETLVESYWGVSQTVSGETQEEWWLRGCMQTSVAASTMWPTYRGLAFCLWLDASFCATQWTPYLPAGSCCKSTALRSALGDVRFYLSDRGMGRKGWKKQRIREGRAGGEGEGEDRLCCL